MIRSMILDSYNWFVDIVDERRPLNRVEVLKLANGSVFTGRQALDRKLVDSLGGEQEAIGWLKTKGISGTLSVIEWKPDSSGSGLLFSKSAGEAIGAAIGLPGAGGDVLEEIGADRLFLDGLVSVWHP